MKKYRPQRTNKTNPKNPATIVPITLPDFHAKPNVSVEPSSCKGLHTISLTAPRETKDEWHHTAEEEEQSDIVESLDELSLGVSGVELFEFGWVIAYGKQGECARSNTSKEVVNGPPCLSGVAE